MKQTEEICNEKDDQIGLHLAQKAEQSATMKVMRCNKAGRE